MRSKNALYTVLSNIVLQFIVVIYGFIIPKIIIDNFGSNVNGLVSSITMFLGYITLLESGFGPVVKSILYKPIAKQDNKTIVNILKASEKFFKRISYIFIAYIILLSFIYPLIVSKNFEFIYTASLIIIISISTFAEYYFGMTYKLYLQAKQKTYVISLLQIFTYLLSIGIIVLLVKLNASIHLIKLFSGLIFVIRPLLQNYYVKKKYNINLNAADNNYDIKQKWDGLAQHIAAVIHGNTDITLLTIFSSLLEVSVYSVYYLVVKGIKSLIQAFSNGIDASFGDMIARKEKNNLNNKFEIYEILYFTIITVVFVSAMILIVPFVSVYTKDVTDVNYVRYLFGYLIVIAEFITAIRIPYYSLTLTAGHFKETRKGAWVECIINIVMSICLVIKFGIVGVVIGTIISTSIRAGEIIYHTNKYILNRNNWLSIKKIFLILIEAIIIVFICNSLPYFDNINYQNWLINTCMVTSISIVIIIAINFVFYRSKFKSAFKMIRRIK